MSNLKERADAMRTDTESLLAEVDAAEALAKKATPGPWRLGNDLRRIHPDWRDEHGNSTAEILHRNGFAKTIAMTAKGKDVWRDVETLVADGLLIAAAHANVDLLTRLAAKVRELKASSVRVALARAIASLQEAHEAVAAKDGEIAELRARLAEAERDAAELQWIEVCAQLLTVHVNGHFACPSKTSPAVCMQWAKNTEKAIAARAQENPR